MKKRTTIALFLPVLLILTALNVFADMPTVKATGTLTSIEEDGSVIIDEQGYKVDPSAVVLNRKGKKISLHSLSIPAAIRFEYIQDKAGFIIVLIQEVKSKEVNNRRSGR